MIHLGFNIITEATEREWEIWDSAELNSLVSNVFANTNFAKAFRVQEEVSNVKRIPS
jgi:hypothetical protein